MPKVHPGLPYLVGSKTIFVDASVLLLTESQFRERFLIGYDRVYDRVYTRAANRRRKTLRSKASRLYVHVLCLVSPATEADEQELAARTDARRVANREEGCQRAWAWVEVARREKEQRQQQQLEQQREAGAGTAAAVTAAVVAATAEVGQEMASAGGSGGAASMPKASKKTAGLLDEFVCPITAEIMTDPVCTLDGFTYERTAITEWLRTNDSSPATGAKLESKTLIPNITVRCLLRYL